MPFDASGNFTRNYNFVQDAANGIKILAARVDGEFDNFANGMNLVFFRDGRVPMQADLRMNTNGITGLKDGTLGSPAIKFQNDPNTGPYSPGLNQYGVQVNSLQRGVFTTTGFDVTGNFTATGNVSGAALIEGGTALGSKYAAKANPTITGQVTADKFQTNGVAGAGIILLPQNAGVSSSQFYTPANNDLRVYQGGDVMTITPTLVTVPVQMKANTFATNGGGNGFIVTPRDGTSPSPMIYSATTGQLNFYNGVGDVIQANGTSVTVIPNTLWLNTNKAVFQHDGANAFLRAQVGGLYLGAASTSVLSIPNATTVQLNTNNTSFQFTDANGGHPYFVAQGDNNFCFYTTDAANNPRGVWSVPAHSSTGTFNVSINSVFAGTLSVDDVTTKRASAPTTGAMFFGNSGGKYLYWDATNFTLSGPLIVNGNISSSSDARLKTDVRPLENARAIVKALQPKRFTMYGKPDFGLIAQEAQRYVPEIVRADDKGMLSLDYGRLVALLIADNNRLAERLDRAGL